jgi:hypothetical protein
MTMLSFPSNLNASARRGNELGLTNARRRQIDPDSHGHDNSHQHINQLYVNRIAFAHGLHFPSTIA